MEEALGEFFVDLVEDALDGGEAAAEGAVREDEVDFGDLEAGGFGLGRVR